MILQEKIWIKIVPKVAKYWKSKGYPTEVGKEILVKTTDLPPKSQRYIDCQCDICNKIFKQRFSRRKDICGNCRMSATSKGNTYGSSNRKYKVPSKNILIKQLKEGKQKVANKYGVSIPVINGWIKKHDISLIPYHGRKYFKTEEEKNNFIKEIESYSNLNISEISKKTGVPLSIINYMKKMGNIKLETQFDVWRKEYQNILDNFDFYRNENKTKTLITISNEQNISVEHLKKAFKETDTQIQLHSYNKSKGELEVKDFIKSLGVDCFSMMLDKIYEIDCYVPQKNIGIEYCGEFWHRFVPMKNNKNQHKNKMDYIFGKNISLLTFFESEWKTKQEVVKSIIRSKLGFTTRIYARKCQVKEISKSEARKFHETNHLSGSSNSSIDLGLYYETELVSVLSIIKSRFDKSYQYEISRFSTIHDTTVIGGLGKLFEFFRINYKPKSVMTYVDLRIGEGKSYEKVGFKYIGKTVPNYYYFHPKIGYLESRMKYQKHNLKKYLQSYDPSKTEYENMMDAGFYKLYDCGNKKYGWKK